MLDHDPVCPCCNLPIEKGDDYVAYYVISSLKKDAWPVTCCQGSCVQTPKVRLEVPDAKPEPLATFLCDEHDRKLMSEP